MEQDWRQDHTLRQAIVRRVSTAMENSQCGQNFKQKTPEELEANLCNRVQTKEQYLNMANKLVQLLEGKAQAVAGPRAAVANGNPQQVSLQQQQVSLQQQQAQAGQGGAAGLAVGEGQLHGQQMGQQQMPGGGMPGMMRGQMGPVSQLQARLTGARMPQQQPGGGMVGAPGGGPGMGQPGMAQRMGMMMPRMGAMGPQPGMVGPGGRPIMVSQSGPVGGMMPGAARGPPPMYSGPGGGPAVSVGGQMGQMGMAGGSPAMSAAAMNMGHSPAQYVHSPQMMGSPSPAGAGGGPRLSSMAPSPMSTANTPQMPDSNAPQQQPASQEDQQYLEKVRQLSRYIEPLREMIARIGNEDQNKLDKMKKLMDILSNPSKRMPMETLLKCEKVLGRMNFNMEPTESKEESSQPTMPSTSSSINPLLECVINLVQSAPQAELNHALQKAFGPPLEVMYGSDIALPPLPPSKKRRSSLDDLDSDEEEFGANMRLILRREIAVLERQFRVKTDPDSRANSSDVSDAEEDRWALRKRRRREAVRLVCSLEDSRLPSVPPIEVTVPPSYPDDPPVVAASAALEYGGGEAGGADDEGTPFLRRVWAALAARTSRMPDAYTLSQLLSAWEASVRAAASPKGDRLHAQVSKETVLLGL